MEKKIINTKIRIKVVSTGVGKNKKGKLVYGRKGEEKECAPTVAAELLKRGWIEKYKDAKEEEKKDDKK